MFALSTHQVKSILFNRETVKFYNIIKYINTVCISSMIFMSYHEVLLLGIFLALPPFFSDNQNKFGI